MGLIHRDLKPPNIFAAYRGGQYDVAKLLDFGLVKATRDEESPALTREGTVTGSPLYMAPEQIMRTHSPEPAYRHLRDGGDRLLPAHRPSAIRQLRRHGSDGGPRPRSGRPSLAVPGRCPGRPGGDRDPMPGEGPRRSLPGRAELGRALAACKDAGSWSPAEAALWWRAHEPSIASEVDLPAPDSRLSPSDCTVAEDESPSLGASQIEMIPAPGPAKETGSLPLDRRGPGPPGAVVIDEHRRRRPRARTASRTDAAGRRRCARARLAGQGADGRGPPCLRLRHRGRDQPRPGPPDAPGRARADPPPQADAGVDRLSPRAHPGPARSARDPPAGNRRGGADSAGRADALRFRRDLALGPVPLEATPSALLELAGRLAEPAPLTEAARAAAWPLGSSG